MYDSDSYQTHTLVHIEPIPQSLRFILGDSCFDKLFSIMEKRRYNTFGRESSTPSEVLNFQKTCNYALAASVTSPMIIPPPSSNLVKPSYIPFRKVDFVGTKSSILCDTPIPNYGFRAVNTRFQKRPNMLSHKKPKLHPVASKNLYSIYSRAAKTLIRPRPASVPTKIQRCALMSKIEPKSKFRVPRVQKIREPTCCSHFSDVISSSGAMTTKSKLCSRITPILNNSHISEKLFIKILKTRALIGKSKKSCSVKALPTIDNPYKSNSAPYNYGEATKENAASSIQDLVSEYLQKTLLLDSFDIAETVTSIVSLLSTTYAIFSMRGNKIPLYISLISNVIQLVIKILRKVYTGDTLSGSIKTVSDLATSVTSDLISGKFTQPVKRSSSNPLIDEYVELINAPTTSNSCSCIMGQTQMLAQTLASSDLSNPLLNNCTNNIYFSLKCTDTDFPHKHLSPDCYFLTCKDCGLRIYESNEFALKENLYSLLANSSSHKSLDLISNNNHIISLMNTTFAGEAERHSLSSILSGSEHLVQSGICLLLFFLALAITSCGMNNTTFIVSMSKASKSIFEILRTGKMFISEIWDKVGETILGQESTAKTCDSSLGDHVSNLSKYAQMECTEIVKDISRLVNFQIEIEKSRELLKTIGQNNGSSHMKASLMRLCEQSESKISKLRLLFRTGLNRVRPVCHVIFGESGIGKTRACIKLAQKVIAKDYPRDTNEYVIPDDNFFPQYLGQNVMRKEEAFNRTNLDDDIFVKTFNNLFSEGYCNLESAFDKLQPAAIKTAFIDTNSKPSEIANLMKTNSEATRGTMDRMTLWEAIWTKDDNERLLSRGESSAFDPVNYSHINFIPWRLIKAKGSSSCQFEKYTVGVPEIRNGVSCIVQKDKLTLEDVFAYDCALRAKYALNASEILKTNEELCGILDSSTSIDNFRDEIAKFRTQAQKQASTNSLVVNITGPSGSGKSTGLVTAVGSYFSNLYKMGDPIYLYPSNWQQTLLRSRRKTPFVYVFDDFVKLSEDNQIENADLYCRIYDQLPNGSLIIFVTNIRSSPTWSVSNLNYLAPVTNFVHSTNIPLIEWYNSPLFLDESKYRRMGFTGTYKVQNKHLIVPDTGLQFYCEDYKISSGNMPISQDEAVNKIFATWSSYLENSGNVIVDSVIRPPTLSDLNFIMRFSSLSSLEEVIHSPMKVVKYLGNGLHSAETIFASPEMMQAISKYAVSTFKYTAPITTRQDLVSVGIHFMKVFRRYNLPLRAKIEITNSFIATFEGVNCKVYYHNDTSAPVYPLTIYDSINKTLIVGETTVSLTDYYEWFCLGNREDNSYLSLSPSVIESINSMVHSTSMPPDFYTQLSKVIDNHSRSKREELYNLTMVYIRKTLDNWKILAAICGAIGLGYAFYKITRPSSVKPSKRELYEEYSKYFGKSERQMINLVEQQAQWGSDQPPDKPSDNLPKPYRRMPASSFIKAQYKWGTLSSKWADEDEEEMRNSENIRESLDKPDFNQRSTNYVSRLYNERIKQNILQITTTSCKPPTTIQTQFALGVSERYFIAPKHVLTENCTITIRDNRVSDEQFFAKCLYEFPEKDLFLGCIEDKTFPMFRDIIACFPSKKTAPRLGDRVVFVRRHKDETEYHTGSANAMFFTPIDLFVSCPPEKDIVRIYHSMCSDNVSSRGDCGQVYIHEEFASRALPAVLGLHVGGSVDGKRGMTYCTLVYNEEVNNAIGKSKRPNIKQSLEIGVPKGLDNVSHVVNTSGTSKLNVSINTPFSTTIYCDKEITQFVSQSITNAKELSILPHIEYPDNEVYTFGTVKGRCDEPKTKLIHTPFSEIASECGISSMKGPTKPSWLLTMEERDLLEKDTRGNPCSLATQTLYLSETLPKIPTEIMKNCVEAWAPFYARARGKYLVKVSAHEALNGGNISNPLRRLDILDQSTFGPLVLDTSAGPTLHTLFGVQKKKDVICLDTETGVRSFNNKTRSGRYLESSYKSALNLLAENKRPFLCYKTCKKSEPLLKPWKARVFESSDILSVLLERTFLGSWVAGTIRGPDSISCRLGLDPFIDFNKLANYHLKKKCHFACDFSRWDKRVNRDLFIIMSEVMTTAHSLYKKKEHTDPCTWCNSVKVIIENMWHSIHIVATNMNVKTRGMPSGCYSTTPLNSDLNELSFFMAYTALLPERIHSWRDFKQTIHLSTCGDDGIVSFDENIADQFNLQTVSHFFKHNLGMILDSMDKDGTLVKYTKDFSEIKFVSRKFTYIEKYGVWIGALKKESIQTRIHYVSSIYNTKEDIAALYNSALYEAALWEPEYFNQFENLFSEIIERDVEYLPLLSNHSQAEILELFYLGIVNGDNELSPVIKESNNFLKLSEFSKSLNPIMSAISIMNEREQAGYCLITTCKDSETLTYSLTMTREISGKDVVTHYSFSESNLKSAKKLCYEAAMKDFDEGRTPSRQNKRTTDLKLAIRRLALRVATDTPRYMREHILSALDYPFEYELNKYTDAIIDSIPQQFGIQNPSGPESEYARALKDHYLLNDHHPEHFGPNGYMTEFATLHCLCDLLACSMRVSVSTLGESLRRMLSWIGVETIKPKFSSLHPAAVTYFSDFIGKNIDTTLIVKEFADLEKSFRSREPTEEEMSYFYQNFEQMLKNPDSFDYTPISEPIFLYLKTTIAHCMLVESLLSGWFGITEIHDGDKLKPQSFIPYLHQWYFSQFQCVGLKNEKQSDVKPHKEESTFVGGNAGAQLETGQPNVNMPILTGIIPGPNQDLVVDNQINQPGAQYTGLVKLGVNETIPDLTGIPYHHNLLENYWTFPQLVDDKVLSEKSASGDHLFTVSADINTFPQGVKDWFLLHKSVSGLSVNTKITIFGTETLIGAIEVVYNPERIDPQGSWQKLRRYNEYVTLGVNGMIKNTIQTNDIFNVGRVRSYDVKFDDNGANPVISYGYDAPPPSHEVYVAKNIMNRYAPTEPFSLIIRVETWLSPTCIPMYPRSDLTLVAKLYDTPTTFSLFDKPTIPFPYIDGAVNLSAMSSNRVALRYPKKIVSYPKVKGLFPDGANAISGDCFICSIPAIHYDVNLDTFVYDEGKKSRFDDYAKDLTQDLTSRVAIANTDFIFASGTFPKSLELEYFTREFDDYIRSSVIFGKSLSDVFDAYIKEKIATNIDICIVSQLSPEVLLSEIVLTSKDQEEYIAECAIPSVFDFTQDNPVFLGKININAYHVASGTTSGYLVLLESSNIDGFSSPTFTEQDFNAEIFFDTDPTTHTYPMVSKPITMPTDIAKFAPIISVTVDKASQLPGRKPKTQSLVSVNRCPPSHLRYRAQACCYSFQLKNSLDDTLNIILGTQAKNSSRDPRVEALRINATNCSVDSIQDVEQIIFDDYSRQMQQLGNSICDSNNTDGFNCDFNYSDTLVASANFTRLYGWGITASRSYVSLNNLLYNKLFITNIQKDQFVPIRTNTNSWLPYYPQQGNEAAKQSTAALLSALGDMKVLELGVGLAEGQFNYNRSKGLLDKQFGLDMQRIAKNQEYTLANMGEKFRNDAKLSFINHKLTGQNEMRRVKEEGNQKRLIDNNSLKNTRITKGLSGAHGFGISGSTMI